MAVLILVILGLTVAIILASTQFAASAGSISDLQSAATQGAETGAQSAEQSIQCGNFGGECRESCTPENTLDLPCSGENFVCCRK